MKKPRILPPVPPEIQAVMDNPDTCNDDYELCRAALWANDRDQVMVSERCMTRMKEVRRQNKG